MRARSKNRLFAKTQTIYGHILSLLACRQPRGSEIYPRVTWGGVWPRTEGASIKISFTEGSEGTSNIRSRRRFSTIMRRALAPVPVSFAFSAIASKEASAKERETPSSRKRAMCCLMIAFLGSARILIRSSLVSSLQLAMLLKRPANLGNSRK